MTRKAAERWGRRGEDLACLWLCLKGYAVLARRVATPVGEVDIVARRGRTTVFVEVKARPSLDQAAAALTPRGMARVCRAAQLLAARYGTNADFMRVDAILVAPNRFPRHLRNVVLEGA
ncbi:YraN family protein [Hankyongella ginsenosidimutans]|uniref:UPF0102 protein E6W36_03495 n=1 Tax=Hankyongella ginsenosidimutans TaxID=1763828 RepID=A0A4D7C5R9_9SPHN|nr:YraN family protein [Hankyongella ginsenosidimutans]QCI78985.1 YraN family protein [Hankyongella ginsenosidimutans]TXG85247.1 MAG: YraN family protein [Sphingomonadales bacterium]